MSVEVVGVEPAGPPDIALPPPAEAGAVLLFARPAAEAPVVTTRTLARKPPAIPADGLMIPQAPNVEPLEIDPLWVARKTASRPAPPPPQSSRLWLAILIALILAAGAIVVYVLLHRHAIVG